MAFIKVGSLVINTTYIAAVNLENKTSAGEESVSLLIAIPKFILLDSLNSEEINPNSYSYEWLDFTGREAQVLQDYFSSFNNVIDLLTNYQENNEYSDYYIESR